MTCGVCLSLGEAAGLAAGSTRARQAMCVVPSAQPPPRPGCVIAMLSSWPQGVCLVAPPGGSHQRPRRDESGERTCLVQHSWGGGGVRAAWPSPRVLGISAVLLPVAGRGVEIGCLGCSYPVGWFTVQFHRYLLSAHRVLGTVITS